MSASEMCCMACKRQPVWDVPSVRYLEWVESRSLGSDRYGKYYLLNQCVECSMLCLEESLHDELIKEIRNRPFMCMYCSAPTVHGVDKTLWKLVCDSCVLKYSFPKRCVKCPERLRNPMSSWGFVDRFRSSDITFRYVCNHCYEKYEAIDYITYYYPKPFCPLGCSMDDPCIYCVGKIVETCREDDLSVYRETLVYNWPEELTKEPDCV